LSPKVAKKVLGILFWELSRAFPVGFNHKNDHFISWGIPGNSQSWYVCPKFEISGEPPIITFFEKFQNRVLIWA